MGKCRSLDSRLPVLAIIVALGGCSDGPGSEPRLQASVRSLPVSASPELGCHVPAILPPGGITAVDTSVTPRANRSAEILAMEASGELVAPTALYQRVEWELAVLGGYGYAQAPVGCGTTFELLVGMTDTGIQQVSGGEYTAWDDYNTTLRVTGITSRFGGYKLTFGGVYNHAALGQAYGQLPEITYAHANSYIGGSVDACLERFGDALDTHVYIFWQGSGDCPSGCLSNSYRGFATDTTGAIEYLGQYNSGGTQPDWFVKARQCRNFL